MNDDHPLRVLLVDDHEVIRLGFAHTYPRLDVVGTFPSTESLIAGGMPPHDVVILDVMLADRRTGVQVASGTAAVRALVGAGSGPLVLYTSVVEDMVIAACLAAGAVGAASKGAPATAMYDVVTAAARRQTLFDAPMAGALHALAHSKHVGALSPQQAQVLRLRAQGLPQKLIAERIGVKDEETVHRYLKAAVLRLTDHRATAVPGAVVRAEDVGRAAGLQDDLVRWSDLENWRRRRG